MHLFIFSKYATMSHIAVGQQNMSSERNLMEAK